MKKVFYLLITLFIVYFVWANLEKGFDELQTLKIDNFESYGDSLSEANIVGFQTSMEAGDYATEGRFRQKIQFYFEQAYQKKWLIPNKTIVVLPEYLGTWLVAVDEKASVYKAPTMQDGLTTMVKSNIFAFSKSYFSAPNVADKVKYAVFAMKAEKMAEVYQKVFADLAKKYSVTVVAGSILLPEPFVENNELHIKNGGMLYNTSVVFRPDGRLAKELIKKSFPTSDEQPFICSANAKDIPVFDTPVGKLGVLICADAWFSAAYKTLKEKGATIVVVPTYSNGNGNWQKPWSGYSGAETPTDAKPAVGKISLGQAWQKYAMGIRAYNEADIKKGVNVFLQGNLWDLGTDGTSIILNDSTAHTTQKFGGSAIVNLWL